MNCTVFCRATSKAVEAAIGSRQWAKAVQILELQDSDMASRYYKKIGDHYASIGEYEVCPDLVLKNAPKSATFRCVCVWGGGGVFYVKSVMSQ